MDAKSRGTFQDKQDICMVLKDFSAECLSVARGEPLCGNQTAVKSVDHN